MKVENIRKHIMTGISYMIPVVVVGGILQALAKLFGGWDIGDAVAAGATPFSNMDPFTWEGFWWGCNQLGSYAMSFAVAIMTGYLAYSIAGRPGIVPGIIIGYACVMSKAGFLGGLLMGFIIGYFILWMKTWKLPRVMQGLMPVLIIPVVTTFVCGMLFLGVFCLPLAWIMDVFQNWIISLNGGSKALIGAIIGACMGFDMGGPVNKTASMAANALGTDGIAGPMTAKLVGGMTPPIGLWIASRLARRKFSKTELDTANTALPMGLCFITEGVLPFAASDPLRFIPCSMAGAAVAGAITVGFGCESVAGHGGIFIVPMMTNPLMFLVGLVVGSLVTGVTYAFLRRERTEEEISTTEDELSVDVEINIG